MKRNEIGLLSGRAISRREWMGRFYGSLCGVSLALSTRTFGRTFGRAFEPAYQQEATRILSPLNRFPQMLQEYYVAQVRGAESAGLKRKMALGTKADAEAYVRDVRARIRGCFGPMPEKSPLNPKVTGKVERATYTIEKILFESRPGFLVTGNLYLPKGRRDPLPAIVATCGHSNNGKAGDTYQSFTQGLAKLGYIVFIIDPLGQGERLQYLDEEGRSRIGNGVAEHLHIGNQMLLTGENLPAWRAWDGIRALDYLLTRPEVDPKRVGVTGNSGGGTVTAWLCALDERWSMAAPGCFITTLRRNIENELPQDTEQYPPRILANRLDHDDFIAAMAPKPVILLAKEKDYFDVRGAEEAYGRLKHLYRLLGAEQNIAQFIGPTYHGYTRENREAMYAWFNRVTSHSTNSVEPEITLEKDEVLQVTPMGQVSGLGSRTVFSFISEKSKRLRAGRKEIGEKELPVVIEKALKLPPRRGVPDARILRELRRRGHPRKEFTTYAVETEPGIFATVYRLSDQPHISRPPVGQKRAALYVSHLSSDDELRKDERLRKLVSDEPETEFFTCDVRGIGESIPNTTGENQFLAPYGNDYLYSGFSLMLDKPIVGGQCFDILRVLDWLKSYGLTEIHLVANGFGTIPATFAAVLGATVTRVTLWNPLTSYADLAETEYYKAPLFSLVPGILDKLDLPDCYRILERKGLQMEGASSDRVTRY